MFCQPLRICAYLHQAALGRAVCRRRRETSCVKPSRNQWRLWDISPSETFMYKLWYLFHGQIRSSTFVEVTKKTANHFFSCKCEWRTKGQGQDGSSLAKNQGTHPLAIFVAETLCLRSFSSPDKWSLKPWHGIDEPKEIPWESRLFRHRKLAFWFFVLLVHCSAASVLFLNCFSFRMFFSGFLMTFFKQNITKSHNQHPSNTLPPRRPFGCTAGPLRWSLTTLPGAAKLRERSPHLVSFFWRQPKKYQHQLKMTEMRVFSFSDFCSMFENVWSTPVGNPKRSFHIFLRGAAPYHTSRQICGGQNSRGVGTTRRLVAVGCPTNGWRWPNHWVKKQIKKKTIAGVNETIIFSQYHM